jgi:hypothetical protein
MRKSMRKSWVRHIKGADITGDKGGMILRAEELTRAIKAPNHQRQSLRRNARKVLTRQGILSFRRSGCDRIQTINGPRKRHGLRKFGMTVG